MDKLTKKQRKEAKQLQAAQIDTAILEQLPQIEKLNENDILTASFNFNEVIAHINSKTGLGLQSAADLVGCYNKSRLLRETQQAKDAFEFLIDVLRTGRTHQEKRKLLQDLGVLLKPYKAAELLAIPCEDRPFQIQMIRRDPLPPLVKRKTFFSDTEVGGTPYHYIGTEAGYYIVGKDESVIFYSHSPDSDTNEIILELVVIRGVGYNCSLHKEFYTWLTKVVQAACDFRRNVRPDHEGSMTQVGLNLAARHVRVLGYAVSFVAKLSQDEITHHDEDAVGAASIAWGIIQAVIPQEIITSVNTKLEAEGLPRLATRNIQPGSGFSFGVGDEYITLPTAERAPPEAYFTLGYESWAHIDPAYCKYAFFFCTSRSIAQESASAASGVDPGISRSTRSQKAAAAKAPVVYKPGANFVDVDLRVVVQQEIGTVISFQPAHLHGTSKGYGASNAIISINFSKRVGDAWAEAQAAAQNGDQRVFELLGHSHQEGAGLDEEPEADDLA